MASALSNGLGGGHCHEVDYIICAAAPRKVVHGTGQSLENGADGLHATQSLGNLVADISRLEIGEDEHVCMTCNRAARGFLFADFRNDCCIECGRYVWIGIKVCRV